MSHPSREPVGRMGDMAPAGDSHMTIMFDGDGDVCVSIWEQERGDGAMASIEFCTFSGGGKSPRTRQALIGVMKAMEADNIESPRVAWPPMENAAPMRSHVLESEALLLQLAQAMDYDVMGTFRERLTISTPDFRIAEWNPLIDEGDALRCAIEKKLDITRCVNEFSSEDERAQDYGRAVCLAIVRAIIHRFKEEGGIFRQ